MWLLTELKQKFTRRIFELAHLCTITVIAGIWTIAPDENPPLPRLVLGLGSRLGLVLGLGATRQLPPRKIAPWLGLGLALGLGAIVLEPLLP